MFLEYHDYGLLLFLERKCSRCSADSGYTDVTPHNDITRHVDEHVMKTFERQLTTSRRQFHENFIPKMQYLDVVDSIRRSSSDTQLTSILCRKSLSDNQDNLKRKSKKRRVGIVITPPQPLDGWIALGNNNCWYLKN